MDSLARDFRARDFQADTQLHASRIAAQVEQEIARHAARLLTGSRLARAARPVLMMPPRPASSAQAGTLARFRATAARLFGR